MQQLMAETLLLHEATIGNKFKEAENEALCCHDAAFKDPAVSFSCQSSRHSLFLFWPINTTPHFLHPVSFFFFFSLQIKKAALPHGRVHACACTHLLSSVSRRCSLSVSVVRSALRLSQSCCKHTHRCCNETHSAERQRGEKKKI